MRCECGRELRQRTIAVRGISREISLACECSARGIEVQRRSTIESLRASVDTLSDIPPRYRDASVDAVPPKPRGFLVRAIDALPDLRLRWNDESLRANLGRIPVRGRGIGFHGSYGAGKSYAIGAMFAAARERLIPSVFVPAAALQFKLESADRFSAKESRDEILERLRTVPLLAIDDFDKLIVSSSSTAVAIFELIDSRSRDLRPLYVTSNTRPEDLCATVFARHAKHGEAVWDRLHEVLDWCEYRGPSRRGNTQPTTAGAPA